MAKIQLAKLKGNLELFRSTWRARNIINCFYFFPTDSSVPWWVYLLVVLGILAIAAIIAGIVLWMKKRSGWMMTIIFFRNLNFFKKYFLKFCYSFYNTNNCGQETVDIFMPIRFTRRAYHSASYGKFQQFLFLLCTL